MKKIDADWIVNNWQWILFFCLMIVAVPTFIWSFITMDSELWDYHKKMQLEEGFIGEIKNINLPPKTEVNNFQTLGKRFTVLVETRYRTELNQREFISYFIKELEKKGWKYYGKEDSRSYSLCRGKYDAALYYEGDGGLFNENGDYYKLNFSFGLRPLIEFNNSRPKTCR